MKHYHILYVTFVLVLGAQSKADLIRCEKYGRFLDTSVVNCKGYFICTQDTSGNDVVLKFTCPAKSIFNSNSSTCEYTTSSSCDYTSTSESEEKNFSDSSRQRNSDIDIVPASKQHEDFQCNETGKFADLLDATCSRYFLCYDTGKYFVQKLYTCPNKTFFDPETQSCSYSYICPSVSTSQEDNDFSVESQTHWTQDTKMNEENLPRENVSIDSVISKVSNILRSFTCSEAGKYPDDTINNCKGYIYCIKKPFSEGFFQISYTCPNNSVFDPVERTCSSSYVCPGTFTSSHPSSVNDSKASTFDSSFTTTPKLPADSTLEYARDLTSSDTDSSIQQLRNVTDYKSDIILSSSVSPSFNSSITPDVTHSDTFPSTSGDYRYLISKDIFSSYPTSASTYQSTELLTLPYDSTYYTEQATPDNILGITSRNVNVATEKLDLKSPNEGPLDEPVTDTATESTSYLSSITEDTSTVDHISDSTSEQPHSSHPMTPTSSSLTPSEFSVSTSSSAYSATDTSYPTSISSTPDFQTSDFSHTEVSPTTDSTSLSTFTSSSESSTPTLTPTLTSVSTEITSNSDPESASTSAVTSVDTSISENYYSTDSTVRPSEETTEYTTFDQTSFYEITSDNSSLPTYMTTREADYTSDIESSTGIESSTEQSTDAPMNILTEQTSDFIHSNTSPSTESYSDLSSVSTLQISDATLPYETTDSISHGFGDTTTDLLSSGISTSLTENSEQLTSSTIPGQTSDSISYSTSPYQSSPSSVEATTNNSITNPSSTTDVTITSTTPSKFVCDSVGRFPNPTISGCRSYILCSKNYDNVYKETTFMCPGETVFDPVTSNCTSPSIYSCPESPLQGNNICKEQGRFSIPSSDCRNYTLCTLLPSGNFISINLSCPFNTSFNPATNSCSTTYICPSKHLTTTESTAFVCSSPGRYLDTSVPNCKGFILCYNTNDGLKQALFGCPGNTTFDANLSVCRASTGKCAILPPNGNTPQQSNSKSNLHHVTETIKLRSDIPFQCVRPGRFSDSSVPDCKGYVHCKYSNETNSFTSLHYNCSGSSIFDPSKLKCVPPDQYTCPLGY